MFTLRPGSRWLLACWLFVLVASSAATAKKKPPKDPPRSDPPPVQYHVTWLYGLDGADAYATDVNVDGIIVGASDGRAVCWEPPYTDAFDLNGLVADVDVNPLGLHLSRASRIHNDGLIAGRYEGDDGSKGVYVYDLDNQQFFYSAPPDLGADFQIRVTGINLDGTVVGVFRVDDGPIAISIVGFAWNCYLHDEMDVYLLPEPYLATDINDPDSFGDAEVVGVIDARSADYAVFSWTLNWLQLNDPASTAVPIGPPTESFPGPVVNNAGAIAALVVGKSGNPRRSVSLRDPVTTEWDILLPRNTNRLAMNDQEQIASSGVPSDFSQGSVIVGGTVWSLGNEQMIVDLDDQWFTFNAVPEAVADASDWTVLGFSPVVGWHYNGPAFLLMPAEYPSE